VNNGGGGGHLKPHTEMKIEKEEEEMEAIYRRRRSRCSLLTCM
jgi:hypothetical protein